MFKKVLNIAAKIIVGIVVFYLFLGVIVIPLVLTWGIKNQGTKILKTPVNVKSVFFNPITLNLNINGFEIRDNDKELMAGFDKFNVNVSFLSLLKKIYRVEALEIDGLKVNVALLSENKINLLELVPVPSAETKPAENKTAPETPAEKKSEMPKVIVDKIILTNGAVRFTDKTVTPNFTTTMSAMDLNITGLSTDAASQAKSVFHTKLDEKGSIKIETLIKPFVVPLQMETVFSLNDYALEVLTPYTGKYTGRKLQDGKLNISMNYNIVDNKLVASHKILVQRFEFGEKVESKDALHLPFGMAVALLEDPQGKINISLPVHGDMSDPEFEYFHLIGQVVRNFFVKLMTKPFAFLASAIGSESGEEELGTVRFVPGKSELSDEDKGKLNTLIKGLKDRPKLYLEVNGSFDPNTDWKAIRTEVFVKDLENLKKETTKTESWVYQQLYERRFGVKNLWALTKKFKVKKGEYNGASLDEEIKRQLIESDAIDKVALETLAQTRAKTVYDFILAGGFDEKRIKIGVSHETQSAMGFVPMEFTLTVFDGESAESDKTAPVADVAPVEGKNLE